MSRRVRRFAKRRAGALVIFLVFFLLAGVFTRPLLVEGSDHTYKDPYDPTFQAWTLAWDAHALTHNPFNLFNANIFFPNRYTLAYSDHQVVTAVIALPLLGVTGNPVQTANYMLIFNLFLCAVGAYLLVMHLTRSRAAGMVAGIIFAFAPPRLAHMGHLQLSAAAFIPLCLLFLHRYSEEGHPIDAVLAALFFVLEALSTWYYGMILAFAILVFLVVRLVMRPRAFTMKWVVSLAVVFALAAGLVMPFALPYLKVHTEDPRFERNIAEVDGFSADVADFAAATENNLLWGKLLAGRRAKTTSRGGPTERTLFPGLLPIVLGILGAIYLFARGRGAARFDVRFYVTLIAASFVMCLGSALFVFGHRYAFPMPYRLFYYLFPGFKVMRVPGRFVILVILGLAVLSGFAIKGATSWISRRTRGKGPLPALAVALVLAMLVLDLMSVSLPMYRVPLKKAFPPVYTWLEEQPGKAPTVELPLAAYNAGSFAAGLQYEPTWLEREPLRTYFSTLHWKEIFNGYSGFIPSSYYEGVKATSDFPSARSIAFLRGEGIQFVVVHGAEIDPSTLQSVLNWSATHPDLERVTEFGSDYVFSLGQASP